MAKLWDPSAYNPNVKPSLSLQIFRVVVVWGLIKILIKIPFWPCLLRLLPFFIKEAQTVLKHNTTEQIFTSLVMSHAHEVSTLIKIPLQLFFPLHFSASFSPLYFYRLLHDNSLLNIFFPSHSSIGFHMLHFLDLIQFKLYFSEHKRHTNVMAEH